MRKACLLPLLVLSLTSLFAQNNDRLFDRPMKVKQLTIKVSVDAFVATTFMEIEFCNPNNKEMEGLWRFDLLPGQVITAFQLDLHGKYRDGSIEEKWKARNAYNTIVGKRIDPALLTMDGFNHYRLNVYPVPARGCRKVTLTIQQLLKEENSILRYSMPVMMPDTVGTFKLEINIDGHEAPPAAEAGVIESSGFVKTSGNYELRLKKEKIVLNSLIRFSVPFLSNQRICATQAAQNSFFALRLKPGVPAEYEIHPGELTVFWDVSGSGEKRSIKKEIHFLRQFVSFHQITQLKVIPFNDELLDTVIFYSPYQSNRRWISYLENLEYDGATQLGCINLTKSPGLVMIFTDGGNTYGNRKPQLNNTLAYWVHASQGVDKRATSSLVGTSGGREVDLDKLSIHEALQLTSKATNWLLDITSASGKTTIEQQLPMDLYSGLFIYGNFPGRIDTLYFHYGNYQGVTKVEKVVIGKTEDCNSTASRIPMLCAFQQFILSRSWEDVLDFGLSEKIVTPNTAYIVLERVEDYIKYNISPPKDLEEECKRLNFVKRDTRSERKRLKQQDEYAALSSLIDVYNLRLQSWDPSVQKVSLSREELANVGDRTYFISSNITSNGIELRGGAFGLIGERSQSLEEVVVVGYGSVRRSSLTGSVSVVRSQDLNFSGSIEQALAGRVAGLMVVPSGNAMRGDLYDVRIRGAGFLNGNGGPLYVLDGIPVTGNINDVININDIDHITVLKDVYAASLYGSRAANGAIIVTSKKGKGNYFRGSILPRYRLRDMEDVEYLQEIKAAGFKEKKIVYDKLRKQYANDPGFYLDMAQHFFDVGLKEQALKMLKNAAEVGNGSRQLLRAIGFILESWHQFPEAILIHQQLMEDSPEDLFAYRDLALAHYQNDDIQKAVDILNRGIQKVSAESYVSLKASMLSELSAIISMHRAKLDLSAIPASIMIAMPVDLRVVVDCNKTILDIRIREPGGQNARSSDLTKNGGVLYSNLQRNSYSFADYMNRDLEKGNYRVIAEYWDYYSYSGRIPCVARIMRFRNFGRENQSIEIENVMLDNQWGQIEIADYKY